MKRKIPIEKKIEFINRNKCLINLVLNPESHFDMRLKKELVRLARKNLHYSNKTVACDILRSLEKCCKEKDIKSLD